MLHGPHTLRAFLLLLAFGLGGLAVPAAHAWSHLGDAPPAVPAQHEHPALLATGDQAAGHACNLCEVRLAAVGLDARQAVTVAHAEAPPQPYAGRAPCAAPCPFFGRAPPRLG